MALQQTYIPHNGAVYAHYYLCNYLPLSAGRDIFSHSLLKFKMGLQPDLSGWIDCSLDMLASGIPGAGPIPGARLIPNGATIVRALHHDELHAAENPPTSLDLLGRALAGRFQSHYRPSLIRKTRPARKINRLTLEQRETELKDIYIMNEPAQTDEPGLSPDNPVPFVLIIDDILTTATTGVRSILTALLNRCPGASIVVFTACQGRL